MHKPSFWIALVVAAIVAGRSAAAQDKSETDQNVGEQIRKMREEVKDLVEAGQKEKADQVEQAIRELVKSRVGDDPFRAQHPDLDQAKHRLAELSRRLAELKERGQADEAERVARQVEEIRQHLARGEQEGGDEPKRRAIREFEEKLAAIKLRIAELKEAGRNDEADRLAQEAREMVRRAHASDRTKFPAGPGGLEHRVEHMREAAKHLHAAGLNDVAEDLMRQAEKLNSAARSSKKDSQPDGRVEELTRALRAMRQRMDRMEKQIAELTERPERR